MIGSYNASVQESAHLYMRGSYRDVTVLPKNGCGRWSAIIAIIVIIVIILQENALLGTLELTDSAGRKGHFAQYTWLALAGWDTMVYSGFTATCSLRNRFTDKI